MRIARAAPFLGVLAYFVFLAWPGLTTRFAPDDMQNLYKYWHQPLGELARSTLLVATGAYRPLGALFYLPVFQLFGLDPLPYRVVVFLLLCFNVWLLYALSYRLSGSRTAAAFAGLVGCFHANAVDAYESTAVVYEVLCFTFLIGALLYYVRIRVRGRLLAGWECAILLALFGAALDAKEMAVILPLMLVIFEWRRPEPPRRFIPAMLCGALALAFAVATMHGDLPGVDAYKPVWTVRQFMYTTRSYAAMLLMRDDMLRQNTALAMWLAMFAAAAALRRRDMFFGAAFALLAFLPLNFVIMRQGYALYIPMAGFGIWAGGLLDIRNRRLAAAVWIAAVIALIAIHYPRARRNDMFLRHAQEQTSNVIAEYRRLGLRPARGSSLLIVDGPFGSDWDMFFIAKLYFRDPTLKVAIQQTGEAIPRGEQHRDFNRILRWSENRLNVER